MSKSAKSFFKRFSSKKLQEPPPPPSLPPPPAEFLCPISNLLMADPVVIPSGHSFDFPCIQACTDLNLCPLHLQHLNLNQNQILIPNLNFLKAIQDWCANSGHPLPVPISSDAARHFVKGLMSSPAPSLPPTTSSRRSLLTSEPPAYTPYDADKEESFLNGINGPEDSSKESAFAALSESPLCSPKILSAILSFISGDNTKFRDRAIKALYNLSLEPANRTHILRSGAIPPLITVLIRANRHASAEATRTISLLADEEANRLAIGALGAIPALLDKFCEPVHSNVGRLEAASTLHHLSYCRRNLEVLVEVEDGVQRVMTTVLGQFALGEEKKYGLAVVHSMVGLRRGRELVMEKKWMQELLRIVRKVESLWLISLAVMFKMCRAGFVKFREAMDRAGGELMLQLENPGWEEEGKEMAKAMVRVIRGQQYTDRNQLKKIDLQISPFPRLMDLVEEDDEGGNNDDDNNNVPVD